VKKILGAAAFFLCVLFAPHRAFAMDRINWQTDQMVPSAWMLQEERDIRVAFGVWIQTVMGNTNGFYANLSVVAGSGMNVAIEPTGTNTAGAIYQYLADDTTPYGGGANALSADPTQIFTQALFTSPSPAIGPLAAPTTTGDNQVYLIECQVQPSTDTDQQTLKFESTTGSISQGTVNETRSDAASCQDKAGTPEVAGSEAAPSLDSGYLPIADVTVHNGDTSSASFHIVMAGGFAGFQLATSTPTYSTINATTSVTTPALTISGLGANLCLQTGSSGQITTASSACGTAASIAGITAGTDINIGGTGTNPVINVNAAPSFATSVAAPLVTAPSGSNLALASNASSGGFASVNYNAGSNNSAGLRVYDGGTVNYAALTATGLSFGQSSLTTSGGAIAGPLSTVGAITSTAGATAFASPPTSNYVAVGTPAAAGTGSLLIANAGTGNGYLYAVSGGSGSAYTLNSVVGSALAIGQSGGNLLESLDPSGDVAFKGNVSGTGISGTSVTSSGSISGTAISASSLTATSESVAGPITATTFNTGSSSYGATSASVNGGIGATAFNLAATGDGLNGPNAGQALADDAASGGWNFSCATAATYCFRWWKGAPGSAILGGLSPSGQLSVLGNMVSTGFNAGSSTYGPTSATINGELSAVQGQFTTAASSANLVLTDNSGDTATPTKFLRSSSGDFQIVNSGFSQSILTLDDTGDLSVNGTIATNSTMHANTFQAGANNTWDIFLPQSGLASGYTTIGTCSGCSVAGVPAIQFLVGYNNAYFLSMDSAGNLGIAGAYYEASRMALKTSITSLPFDALKAIDQTNVLSWCYKDDKACRAGKKTKNIGPMADFANIHMVNSKQRQAVNVDNEIGISMAAIKELDAKVVRLAGEVASLMAEKVVNEAYVHHLLATIAALEIQEHHHR
jgi:hypothetical protein